MNKINLEVGYKTNKEFNENDLYIFHDLRFFISNVHKHNGVWYTNESLKFKAETIECINWNDVVNRRVQIINKDLKEGEEIYGTVIKYLSQREIGILWDQGKKRYLPYFWNDINTIRFI